MHYNTCEDSTKSYRNIGRRPIDTLNESLRNQNQKAKNFDISAKNPIEYVWNDA